MPQSMSASRLYRMDVSCQRCERSATIWMLVTRAEVTISTYSPPSQLGADNLPMSIARSVVRRTGAARRSLTPPVPDTPCS